MSLTASKLQVKLLLVQVTKICVKIATDIPCKFRQPPISYSTHPVYYFF